MDESTERALRRLREDESATLRSLARMVVDQTTATPLSQIAAPRWIASQLLTALQAATQGDRVRDWVLHRLEQERTRLQGDTRTLGEMLPDEAEEPLRTLLRRHYVPDRDLTLRLIDQPAIRGLVRLVLGDTVRSFRQRLSAIDGGKLRDIRKRASKRGRGLFAGVAENLAPTLGNLGGVAENLVGVVRDEVEGSLDARLSTFLRGATQKAVEASASYVADPEQAKAMSELRLGVLDVLLDTPLHTLVREGDKLGPKEMMDVVLTAVRANIAQPDALDRLEQTIHALLDEAGDGTLGAWLEEVGLADVWTETTTELVQKRLGAVVATDAFTRWWANLHS